MIRLRRTMVTFVGGASAAIALAGAAAASSGNFLLVRRNRPVQSVVVAEIGPHRLVHRDDGDSWSTVPRSDCVALLDPEAVVVPRRQGWLRLTDGQRFPGQALSAAPAEEGVLVWIQSSWLGRIEVPLDRIESVTFVGGSTVPPPGDADVLMLANGDRLEGLVTSLGDPVTVEVFNTGDATGTRTIELPLDRVTAVRMVTPAEEPTGQRLWLVDGTVVDVGDVMLADDGLFRLEDLPFVADGQPRRIEMNAVAGLRFSPQAVVPVATLTPLRVSGPSSRYVVPPPDVLDDFAPLGLGRVEFRGPLSVEYPLPEGAVRISAEAMLPPTARSWGDCELIMRVDGRPVFSATLNADQPTASIDAPVNGSLLTVEVTEGAGGPIQDRVVLLRAMILVGAGAAPEQ